MQRTGSTKSLKWFTREWRIKKGLSQDQLAEMLDTNRGQISKLERGDLRMNDDWIAGIASAMGIEPSDLLRDPADPPSLMDVLRHLSAEQEQKIREFIDFILQRKP